MNVILCGASGAGKTTIANELFKDSDYKKFTSVTSRTMREGEINGDDYYFFEKEELLKLINDKKLFNLVSYGKDCYATVEEFPEKTVSDKNIVSIIIPSRAIEYKNSDKDNNCIIFILTPGIEELTKRANGRNIERIDSDIENIDYAYDFDYVVINDNLADAVKEIKEFINEYKIKRESNLNKELILAYKEELINYKNNLEKTNIKIRK